MPLMPKFSTLIRLLEPKNPRLVSIGLLLLVLTGTQIYGRTVAQ